MNRDVLNIDNRLDIETAPQVRTTLMDALAERPSLVLDLSAVERCDVAGLQILLAANNTARASGKSFSLRAPSPAIFETAASAGLPLSELICCEE